MATLSWPNSQDLDLYLYSSGSDLLSRSGWIDREFSGSLNPEVLQYTISTTGLYYVRADLYSSTPTAYSLEIKVSNNVVGTYYDTVLSYTTARTVSQFTTQNPCTIQITYSGYVCPMYLFAPGVNVVSGSPYASDTSSSNPKTIRIDLNQAGNWNVVLHHGITSSTSMSDFTLDLITDTNNECINFCTGKSNSAGLAPGTTNICKCLTNFNWDSSSQQCIIVCSNIYKATTIKSGTTDQCNCQTNYSWDTAITSCAVPCTSLANAVSSASVDTCNCATGYQWEAANYRCVRNCSAIAYGTTLVSGSTSDCNCQSGFIWDSAAIACKRDCDVIPYADGLVSGSIIDCACQSGFNWVSASVKCFIDCGLISDASGSVSGSVNSCTCRTGFYWDSLNLECVRNCTIIPYNAGLESGSISICACQSKFLWNSSD